jgi:DNA-binding XRE family transcriptional regulator
MHESTITLTSGTNKKRLDAKICRSKSRYKQAIHDIETGKQKPSYDVLLKLLALFNVEHKNIFQLFAPVENETPSNSNTDKEDVEVREHPAVAAVPSEVSPGVVIEAEAAG